MVAARRVGRHGNDRSTPSRARTRIYQRPVRGSTTGLSTGTPSVGLTAIAAIAVKQAGNQPAAARTSPSCLPSCLIHLSDQAQLEKSPSGSEGAGSASIWRIKISRASGRSSEAFRCSGAKSNQWPRSRSRTSGRAERTASRFSWRRMAKPPAMRNRASNACRTIRRSPPPFTGNEFVHSVTLPAY